MSSERLPSIEPWRVSNPGTAADLHSAATNAKLAKAQREWEEQLKGKMLAGWLLLLNSTDGGVLQ